MKPFNASLLTGAQLRAARALLGVSASDLAATTKLGIATIRRAEANPGRVSMTPANAERLVRALEEAGVEFIPQNGGGGGVRLTTPEAHE
jgi:predicted transcriptional regulator